MDEKELDLEKLKASIEMHKAYIVYWQTMILSKVDISLTAYGALKNHLGLIVECVEGIMKIK